MYSSTGSRAGLHIFSHEISSSTIWKTHLGKSHAIRYHSLDKLNKGVKTYKVSGDPHQPHTFILAYAVYVLINYKLFRAFKAEGSSTSVLNLPHFG